jgi:hypothetical protein
MQEKDNEDELAGLTVWILDSRELGRGPNAVACPIAGTGWCDEHTGGHL